MKGVIQAVLWLTLSAGIASSQVALSVPSGQGIELFEHFQEDDTNTLRLRFIAPDLANPAKRPSFEDLTADLEALCNDFGLKEIVKDAAAPAQIVVSLSAEPVEFGVSNADVEQVFEAFSVQNQTCMLEMF